MRSHEIQEAINHKTGRERATGGPCFVNRQLNSKEEAPHLDHSQDNPSLTLTMGGSVAWHGPVEAETEGIHGLVGIGKGRRCYYRPWAGAEGIRAHRGHECSCILCSQTLDSFPSQRHSKLPQNTSDRSSRQRLLVEGTHLARNQRKASMAGARGLRTDAQCVQRGGDQMVQVLIDHNNDFCFNLRRVNSH